MPPLHQYISRDTYIIIKNTNYKNVQHLSRRPVVLFPSSHQISKAITVNITVNNHFQREVKFERKINLKKAILFDSLLLPS